MTTLLIAKRLSNIALLIIFQASLAIAFVSYYSRVQTSPSTSALYSSTLENTPTKPLKYDLRAWKSGFETCKKEVCEKLNGNFPSDISGTYFRNGYGKFEVGKDLVMHPFDADGMICAVTISNGSAVFRNRIVQTKGYKAERKARKIMYRGAFGTQRRGGMLSNIFDTKIKNVANTNVIYWAGRLLALWEGGLPHRMEPDSLRTLGEYTFKGLLQKGGTFSAHPRIDAKTGNLVNFSPAQGAKSCALTIFEFDKDLKVATQRTFEVPGFVFFHDFVVTENYYIFNQAPVSFDPVPFLLGSKGPAACISYTPERPATLYLVPRDSSKPVEVVPVDAHFNFHFANAFEEGGNVIFDVVKCDKMTLGDTSKAKSPIWEEIVYEKEVPYSILSRYTLSKQKSGGWSYESKPLSPTQLDFTSVSPKVSCAKHRYVYGSCGSDPTMSTPVQGLIKIDTLTGTESKWFGEESEYLGENIFVPRSSSGPSDEDDGYVMTISFNGKDRKSQFLLFDAKDIQKGPISRSDISTNIPSGLHGSWAQGLTFPEEDIIRKWKACAALDNKNWNVVKSDFSGLGISFDI